MGPSLWLPETAKSSTNVPAAGPAGAPTMTA